MSVSESESGSNRVAGAVVGLGCGLGVGRVVGRGGFASRFRRFRRSCVSCCSRVNVGIEVGDVQRSPLLFRLSRACAGVARSGETGWVLWGSPLLFR